MASKKTIDLLLQRFGGATVELLDRVLTPYRLQITEINKTPVGRKVEATFPPAATQIPPPVATSKSPT